MQDNRLIQFFLLYNQHSAILLVLNLAHLGLTGKEILSKFEFPK